MTRVGGERHRSRVGSWLPVPPHSRGDVMGSSRTFGLSLLTPEGLTRFSPTVLIKGRGLSPSPSCRKQSICMIFVTRGHCWTQAGDTAEDTKDLPPALRCG